MAVFIKNIFIIIKYYLIYKYIIKTTKQYLIIYNKYLFNILFLFF